MFIGSSKQENKGGFVHWSGIFGSTEKKKIQLFKKRTYVLLLLKYGNVTVVWDWTFSAQDIRHNHVGNSSGDWNGFLRCVFSEMFFLFVCLFTIAIVWYLIFFILCSFFFPLCAIPVLLWCGVRWFGQRGNGLTSYILRLNPVIYC